MPEITGLLYSQIGYDLGDPMRALVRAPVGSTNPARVPPDATFEIADATNGAVALAGPLTRWGELWQSAWWVADFSPLRDPGDYCILIRAGETILFASDIFKVDHDLLWRETIVPVALDQLEERARLARYHKGWKDCGWDWREVNSHATTLIGLCDLLNAGYEHLSDHDLDRLIAQIIQGCDYLAACQDHAGVVGFPTGAIVHELPHHMLVIPGDVAQSAVALARASRLLADIRPDKSADYLARAIRALDYLLTRARPFGGAGFSHSNHGAPPGFIVPDQFMTRDLFMMMWAAVELWAAGQLRYQSDAARLARQIAQRQVLPDSPEGPFFGHFRTFDGSPFTEKANIHHHVGHDTGGTFPHYVLPLIDMQRRWYDHPDADLWREMLRRFAYGYFLPACRMNPFYLLPEGYFTGEGLLVFCGPWHGINTSYGFASALATWLEQHFGDRAFRDIATGNLQWIAGLNAGLTRESFDGCLKYHEDLPAGVAEPRSQIVGIGRRTVGNWTGIRGTIPNGFSANPQFQLVVPPTAANDGPWHYCDEDWIPHAAGWISALSAQRERRFFKP